MGAEISLGRPQALFTGTVSRVFVDEGQYVLPGTPLLTLVGSGARELEVSVPSYLLSGVKVGQEFVVNGKTLGFVDRYSPVSESGSGMVVLSLSGDAIPAVGMTLSGSVSIVAEETVYQVPRSYVHFDADGAYLMYEDGEVSRVQVVYDTGRELFVEVADVRTEPLMAAVSISL